MGLGRRSAPQKQNLSLHLHTHRTPKFQNSSDTAVSVTIPRQVSAQGWARWAWGGLC